MKERRIGILDSFRFLAIISVILYHYTCRYGYPGTGIDYYPFHYFYGEIFRYGNQGVEFFFIISGFVISYTLENTAGLTAFFKNRFIRLFPPMLFWSVLTWLVCISLDNTILFPYAHREENFLPSLTFIHPFIWEVFLKIKLNWLSGSYWSLWPEVQFYFIAAILFFFSKKNFFRNILMFTSILILEERIPVHFPFFYHWNHLNQVMNISYFISYFTWGVIFHHLYKKYPIGVISAPGFCIIFISFYQFYTAGSYQIWISYLVMAVLFLLMIYRRSWLFFLENPLFRRIGVISYSIYLAHEYIGVLLISKYGGYLGSWSPLSVLVMLVLVILAAELSYRFIEQRVGDLLRRFLFRSSE